MTPRRRGRDRACLSMWLVLGCTACACSSTNVTPVEQDGSTTTCEDLAGTWDVTGCGARGQCTVAQQTCSLSVVCSAFLIGEETATGTIDTDDFTFMSESGTCTGTVSGTVLAGTCTSAADGSSCAVTGTLLP